MYKLQNLHTHSTYCDGIDTPEEVLLKASNKGFSSVGFSGHSYTFYSPGLCMSPNGTEEYKREIARLKEKYLGRIDVYCGLEFDMYSEIETSGYDYIIGSMHYFKMEDGSYVGFDRSAEEVKRVIDDHFEGVGMAYAKMYYEKIVDLPKYANIDIIGHFDLITKHMEKANFFDTDSKEYRHAALDAIHALQGKIPLFEVNTGAISRGYRTSPYPQKFIIKEFRRLGFGAVITSDCHDVRNIDCCFDDAAELLRSCGFKEKFILTDDGFCPVAL